MIARLEGKVVEKGISHALLDVGGVGYKVHASLNTLANLPPLGERAGLRIHTHVREDALDLYGFASEVEEVVFHQLISTPNIGPKKAILILSGLPAEEIVVAVREEDAGRLARAHGVGRKTAERLVVELRDRLAHVDLGGEAEPAEPATAVADPRVEELVSGLVNLGFKGEAAQQAAEVVIEEMDGAELPTLLREALRRLRK